MLSRNSKEEEKKTNNSQSIDLLWPEQFQKSDKTSPIKHTKKSIIDDFDLDKLFQLMNLNLRTISDTFSVNSILNKFTTEPEVIKYRLEIIEDIMNNPQLFKTLKDLLPKIEEMNRMTSSRAAKTSRLKKIVTKIGKLELYVESIKNLKEFFEQNNTEINSRGLKKLKENVNKIADSELFQSLVKELPKLKNEFEGLRSITLGINLDAQLRPDQAVLVSINDQVYQEGNILDKLLSRDSKQDNFKGISSLKAVSKGSQDGQDNTYLLNKSILQQLEKVMKSVIRSVAPRVTHYMKNNTQFILSLKPAIKFYLGAVKLIHAFQKFDLPMCKPEIAPKEKRICKIKDNYNLNLARQLNENKETQSESDEVVKNEVNFNNKGRIFILTGPNRGGKTTYLQAVGISQLLFQLGIFIPGSEAEISPCDNIFTHFPIQEKLKSNLGRLGEECNRLKEIFNQATKYSLILLNESLASTSPQEGLYIAREIISSFKILGSRVIYATHFHKLATNLDVLNENLPGDAPIKSLVAGLKEKEDGMPKRTYKIKQDQPLGLSYARNIANNLGISIEKILNNLQDKDKIDQEVNIEEIKSEKEKLEETE